MAKNEKLVNLYYTPNILRVIKRNEMSGACCMYGRKEWYTQGLVGRLRRIWDDNIKMDLQEV